MLKSDLALPPLWDAALQYSSTACLVITLSSVVVLIHFFRLTLSRMMSFLIALMANIVVLSSFLSILSWSKSSSSSVSFSAVACEGTTY